MSDRGRAALEDGPGPHCPTCRRRVQWNDNPTRPFCSVSCKLVDLGRWLDERFTLPGLPAAALGAPEPPAFPDGADPPARRG